MRSVGGIAVVQANEDSLPSDPDPSDGARASVASTSLSARGALGAASPVLIAAGIALNLWNAPVKGQDFAAYYYPAAKRFLHGESIYVLSGDVARFHDAQLGLAPPIEISGDAYPPLHAALLAPLALMRLPVAQYVFLGVSLAILCLGLSRLLAVLAPRWPPELRSFAVGAATFAGSVRWSSGQYQLSLFALGIVCLAVDAEMRNKTLTVVALLALSVKTTMVLPVVALLLFRRKIVPLVASGLLAGALNLAGFAWMGFARAFAGWRINLANYVVMNGLNYQSVSTLVDRANGLPARATMPAGIRMFDGFYYYYYPEGTHWVLLMSGFTSSYQAAKTLALLGGAAFAIVLAFLGYQLRDRHNDREALVRWFIAWSCFDLVAVTHLKYDLLLLLPVMYLSLEFVLTQKRNWPDLLLLFVSFLSSFCLAARFVTPWVFGVAVPLGQFWLVPVYAYLATVAFGLSLWSLAKFTLAQRCKAQTPSTHIEL